MEWLQNWLRGSIFGFLAFWFKNLIWLPESKFSTNQITVWFLSILAIEKCTVGVLAYHHQFDDRVTDIISCAWIIRTRNPSKSWDRKNYEIIIGLFFYLASKNLEISFLKIQILGQRIARVSTDRNYDWNSNGTLSQELQRNYIDLGHQNIKMGDFSETNFRYDFSRNFIFDPSVSRIWNFKISFFFQNWFHHRIIQKIFVVAEQSKSRHFVLEYALEFDFNWCVGFLGSY